MSCWHVALTDEIWFHHSQDDDDNDDNDDDDEVFVSGGGKAPVLISHQRQLSLSVTQVQERLIKNKTLFTAVEPAISCTSLQVW